MSQWEDFFNTQPGPATANYNLDVLADFRAYRFNQSTTTTPTSKLNLLAVALKYPQFLDIGGNTGTANTFCKTLITLYVFVLLSNTLMSLCYTPKISL
jgi:hypothetical protein